MKTSRKALSLLIALALMTGALASCAAPEEEAAESASTVSAEENEVDAAEDP